MAKRACASRLPERVRGPDDAVAYVIKLGGASYDSGELVLGFDAERRIAGCAVRPAGEHPPTDADQLIDIAAELEARMLVLVTFVDASTLIATAPGVQAFERQKDECAVDGVLLADHILMAGHHWRSLAEVSGPNSTR